VVVGTVDRVDWRRGAEGGVVPQGMIALLHDFKDVIQFKFVGGWGPSAFSR
jgi:hypothetical protein